LIAKKKQSSEGTFSRMYQKTQGENLMPKGKNHLAVIQLKLLGFPLANIRKCLHKLTSMSQPEMARLIDTSRQNITHQMILGTL